MTDLGTAIELRDVPQVIDALKRLIEDYKPSDFLHPKPADIRPPRKLRAI